MKPIMNLGFTRDDAVMILYQLKKGVTCRNILTELMYMIMTNNKGYFWTWPFNFNSLQDTPRSVYPRVQNQNLDKAKTYACKFHSLQRLFWKTKETNLILLVSHESMHHSPRVAFFLYYSYFTGSRLLYLKVTRKGYFHDLGGCWGEEEWGGVYKERIWSAHPNPIRAEIEKNYPSFGWITNDHSQTP